MALRYTDEEVERAFCCVYCGKHVMAIEVELLPFNV